MEYYTIEELTMILEYLDNTKAETIGDAIDEVYGRINYLLNKED